MRRLSTVGLLLFVGIVGACSSSSSGDSPGSSGSSGSSSGDAGDIDTGVPSGTDGGTDATPPSGDAGSDAKPPPYDSGLGPANVRVAAANLTSGSGQSYDPGEGIRILQGIKPDVTLMQEVNYGTNSDADIRSLVDKTFGTTFSYYREAGAQIPNAVVSRWPILASGTWTDPQVANRGFAWAKIQAPGAKPLWAVSMHLLTSSGTNRNLEAQAVVAQVNANIPKEDLLVIGGDFNTDTRTETCITTFGGIVSVAGPYPADNAGNENTSGTRSKPHDWVLASPGLAAAQVATVIGADTFPNGLVFDSRVYTPLADVSPVMLNDCGASGMQHMAVVKDFHLE